MLKETFIIYAKLLHMIKCKIISKIEIMISLFLMINFITYSCSDGKSYEKSKNEIRKAEKEFQQLLVSKGPATAFFQFAADSAVIKRENDTLIYGSDAIKKYYSNPFYNNAVAVWEPDYIGVSDDGTMAYTFGKYEWTFTDSTGKR